jgi:TnpA family transposase
MKQNWDERELSESWTLTDSEKKLLQQRAKRNRLGFAILLKFFQLEGRFPTFYKEVPKAPIDFLADQIDASTDLWFDYPLKSRTGKRDRQELRAYLGFRPATAEDSQPIQQWLLNEIVPRDQEPRHLKAAVLDWCRDHHIEPPTNERIDRLIGAMIHRFENQLFADIHSKLSVRNQQQLDTLLTETTPDGGDTDVDPDADIPSFSRLKRDPGRIGLKSILKEIAKLKRIEDVQLPDDLFADVPPQTLERLRLRVTTESLQDLQRHPDPIRYTLLAAFCWQRRKALIDGLLELLIQIVHRVSVKAEKNVVRDIIGDLEKVHGKTTLLYRLAEAAMKQPDGTVREVLFPVCGEYKLEALVKEYHSKGPVYRRHVHTLLRSSYSHHYRRMMPLILDTLLFRSNNSVHQPVIDALDWLKSHRNDRGQFINCAEIPIDGIVRPQLQDLLLETAPNADLRINRINYEICVLQALREGLRCKEIWVEGANQYCNPDDDLPTDFVDKRAEYYEALQQPNNADHFIETLQQAMHEALVKLDADLPNNDKVRLRDYGENRIVVTPSDPQPEPSQLSALKTEIGRRWPMTNLLDVLKETDLRVDLTDVFKSLGTRAVLDRDTLQKRLLLCLYGLGTNAGLRRMVANDSGFTYRELLYVRHRFIEKNALREAIRRVVNATFAARVTAIWGEGTTACASDSKKFGAWDQNLMTEWHIRYGGRGVMIYWHVEKKAACIYSQLKRCSSSEVASMIEGVLRHCTDMEIDQHYVDSKGQSEVAFAFCHLLRFNLLPRLKAISSQKLYRPVSGRPEDYANLQPILIRPINWELIRQQYDEMIKFTTALRLGTAEPEAILRRFTRNNRKHPTYQALAELGKAVKTIFLCQYLSSEPLRIEINEGLNVVENWNSANSFVFFGKNGEVATNRLEDQEVSVLSLHLLQACLVYVNTLMIQRVLAEPLWLNRMQPEDLRGLTPLIYAHVNPYGYFELDMETRLPIEQRQAA